jgi:hypothetical protein
MRLVHRLVSANKAYLKEAVGKYDLFQRATALLTALTAFFGQGRNQHMLVVASESADTQQ